MYNFDSLVRFYLWPLFFLASKNFLALERRNWKVSIYYNNGPWCVFLTSRCAKSRSVLSTTNWRKDVLSGNKILLVLSYFATFCLYRAIVDQQRVTGIDWKIYISSILRVSEALKNRCDMLFIEISVCLYLELRIYQSLAYIKYTYLMFLKKHLIAFYIIVLNKKENVLI